METRKIFIDISTHFTLTVILSALIFSRTNNIVYGCSFLISGIFIDLDHFIDYFIFFKNKFCLATFLNCEYLKSGKSYLFLHSWELIFIILMLSFYIKSQALWLASLSLSLHLAIDNVQRKNLFAYLIFYRIYNRFNAAIIFPEFKGKFY